MEKVPPKSRRVRLAGLQCVWEEGLQLPWPINTRRDFGKTLPPVGRRETPPDSDIKPWAEAVSHEPDPYLRLLVLCLLQYGWRLENQLSHLRWRCVRYDEAGRPRAFWAKAGDEGFKTSSDIVALVFPDVAEALSAWKAVSPDVSPEAYILPWRGTEHRGGGIADPSRGLNKDTIRRWLRWFERKFDLKHLAPVYARHWVKTTCRPLSDPALAALQGHSPPKDGSMRNTYDTPGVDRILAEQGSKFPNGPLGMLRAPTITVDQDLRDEMELVREWKAGRLGLMELLSRLEALQRKSVELSAIVR